MLDSPIRLVRTAIRLSSPTRLSPSTRLLSATLAESNRAAGPTCQTVSMFTRRMATGWLIAYLAVSAVDVLGVLIDSAALHYASKPLLMPLLLAYFVASLDGLKHRLVSLVKAALVCAWVGDILLMLDGEAFFALGLLSFLAAQVCYIVGFRPYAGLGPLRTRPWLVLPYAAYGLALYLVLLPGLGVLAAPVALYTAALVTMAVLATGIAPRTAVGAILFVLSDSLIALTELTDVLPAAAGMLIMPTYIAGQLLIVLGVLQNLGRGAGVRDLSATH